MQHLRLSTGLAVLTLVSSLALSGCDGQSSTATKAPEPAGPVPVQLPDGVISAENSVLVWMDLENLSRASFEQSKDAMISVLNEPEQSEAKEDYAEMKADVDQAFAIHRDLLEAGVRAVVMASPPSSSDDDEDKEDEADEDASDDADEVDDANEEPAQQVLILIRPGTSPQQTIIDSLVKLDELEAAQEAREAAEDNEEPEPREPFDPDSVSFVSAGENWLAVISDDSVGPAIDMAPTLDTKTYVAALEREAGAVVRVAWVMNDASRQALREQMTSGFAAMFLAPVITPLQQMKDATGGMWLGSEPKARIAFNFDSDASALQFKGGVDSLVMMVGGLMSLGSPDTPEEKAEAEKTRKALAMIIPNREAETVHKTFDLKMMRQMAELGMPWYSDDDDEESEDEQEPATGADDER